MTGELTYFPADEQDRGLIDDHSAPMDEDPSEQDASGEVKQSDIGHESMFIDKDLSHGEEARQGDMHYEGMPTGEDFGERSRDGEAEENESAPQRA